MRIRREDAYQAIIRAPGVCYHQVDRALDDPRQLLTVHGWSELAALERFRREVSPRLEAALARLGASVDRFTGIVVAEHDLGT